MFLNPLLSYINKGGAVFWLSGMGWFSKRQTPERNL